MSSFREISGNFSRSPSVPLAKRMYEGLFHKFADENLAAADRACGGDCLPGRSNRGTGGSARRGARGCADGAERHLISDRMIGPLARNLVGPASIPASRTKTR